MGIKKFTLTENSTLSQEEKKMIKKAKKSLLYLTKTVRNLQMSRITNF